MYEIKDLVFEDKNAEAAAYYDNVEKRNAFNAWDCYYCAKALQKVGRDADAIELYRYYKSKFGNEEFICAERFVGLFGWSVYREIIKNFDFETRDASIFKDAVDEVLKESSADDWMIRWCVIDQMVKAITKKKCFGNTPDLKLVNEYLDKIDPKVIPDEEGHSFDGQGIVNYTMGKREQWYIEKTKVLLGLGEYENCINTCDAAFSNVQSFHNKMDKWIMFRKAKSLIALEKYEEAISIVKSMVNSGFNEPCLEALLFDFAVWKGEKENALMHASSVIRSYPDYSKTVNVLYGFSQFLLDNGFENEAYLHRCLEKLLRAEAGWSVKEKPIDSSIPSEYLALTTAELLARLKPLWNEWSELGKTFITGTISKILPSGNDGFIRTEDGHSYYFAMRDVRCKRTKVIEGACARFTLKPSFDKKRNEMRESASEITII